MPPAFKVLSEWLTAVDSSRRDLVDGLLEHGCLYLVAGRYKSGKTILAMNLAREVARRDGGRWLGRGVRTGEAYVIQLEDSDRLLARRWEKMGAAGLGRIRIARGPWQLNEENLTTTIAALKNADLVLVDPLIGAATVSDWSDMTVVRGALEFWRRLARETDAVVMLVAHHRKMAGEDGDQVAGSHRIGATVDGSIEMRRGGSGLATGERRLTFTGRDWADIEDLVVALQRTQTPLGLTMSCLAGLGLTTR